MGELIYKEIPKEDEKQVRDLIENVIGNLERPEFFIPYDESELTQLFDKSYAPLHGAYDNDKLVGMSQLYVKREFLQEYIDILNLNEYKVCELGGDLVLSEYRGRGIITCLHNIDIKLAKKLGFDCIVSMCHPDNLASKKALEKAGLKYIKTAIVNGGFDRALYFMKI